jgi:outer membrane receptor protein involved in Fe transport
MAGLAQAAPEAAVAAAPAADAPVANKDVADVVVVTGRAGTGKRSKVTTSYSVTTIGEEAARMQAATSVAEVMKSVPGFWVEASGGEASNNIRARGIPADGYKSVNLLEDGIPVQHDPYPNSMTADQSFRFDETIDHIEVVRGGPSSTFYSNAPAAAMNFIPRSVGDTASGLVKYTVGDHRLNRVDFWYGTPLGDGWKAYTGGFYRKSHGQRESGYESTVGGQVRVGLSKDIDHGQISIDLKHLDDTVPFYTPVPMQRYADKVDGVPGFDAGNGSYVSPEMRNIALKRGDGSTYKFDSATGTTVKRDQVSLKFNRDLGAGWSVSDGLRYSDAVSERSDVTATAVAGTAAFLAGRVSGTTKFGVKSPQLVYASNLQPYTGNGLVMTANVGTNRSALKDFSNDLQLHRLFDMGGGQKHDVTVGYAYSHYTQRTNQIGGQVLMAAQNQAPLLALVGANTAGTQVTLSDPNGVVTQGSTWANDEATVTSNSIYLADEWQVSKALRIDAGARYEKAVTEGWSEITANKNLGGYATAAVKDGSGKLFNFSLPFSKAGYTLGANYQLTPRSGMFARYTSTFRLPGLNVMIPAADTRVGKQFIETMKLGEIGYKLTDPMYQFYPTLFITNYDNATQNSSRIDPADPSKTITETAFFKTKTYGLELEGKLTPHPMFDLGFNATIQSPKYGDYVFYNTTGNVSSPLTKLDFTGNQLVRVPKVGYRVTPGVNLMDQRLRLQVSYEHQGMRFVDAANSSVVLAPYYVVNASARYEVDSKWSLYGYVDNVTNSKGLTEGNPRASEIVSTDVGANTFLARPVLGRSVRFAAKYQF